MTRRFRPGTILPLILVTSLLTACGFQLRGKMDIASEIAQLAVSGSDLTYVRDLRRALTGTGIEVTDSAPYKLRLINLERVSGERNLGSAGHYEQLLTLNASYQIETSDGLPLFSVIQLTSERSVSQDRNQANAARNEENIIFNELRQELIMNTVRRIASLSGEALRREEERARKVRQMEQEALE
ncbi:MAG: hypothetical protein ACR2PT_23370 [Endozoicomonas sp.]